MTRDLIVLIIDGNDDAREIALMGLETAGGFRVTTAKNGKEGLDAAYASHHDVFLIDPKVSDAKELIDLVKEEGLPIIIYALDGKQPSDDELQKWGVIGTIPKPFAPDMLGHQIIRLFSEWSRGS